MPDNTQYTFTYNDYGELSKITYPTGGYVKYEYAPYVHQETFWAYTMASCPIDQCASVNIKGDFREVNKKRVCSANVGVNGSCPNEDVTVYVPNVSANTSSNLADDVYEGVTDTAVPPLAYLRRTVQAYSSCNESDLNFSRYCTPKDAGHSVYDSSGTLLKRTAIAYYTYGLYPFLPSSITTSYNGGAASTEQLSYDTQTIHVLQPLGVDFSLQTLQNVTVPLDNVTERKVFDYGQTTTPLRREVNTYLHYITPHIFDRKLEQQIYDGANNLVGDTKFEYDNPLDGTVASGAVNHEAHGAAGNISAIKRWRNTDNTWLTTYYRKYDDAGNVLLVQDPLGHQTQLFYDDLWGDSTCAPTGGSAKAYLTKVITPAGITTQGKYNSCTGKVASIIDPNLQVTSYTYDLFGRLLTALSPANGSITFSYPNPNTVNRSQAITATLSLNHTMTFDGRGRITTSALTSDPQGTTYTDTTYDAVGRVQTVSNPYRTGDTNYYTTTAYDALDRVKTVTQPDNSTVQTAYSTNTTTVTDEAGKQRKTTADALGRLTQVLEPDATGALNWQTNYSYGALGNLLCVEQQGSALTATGCSTVDYYGGDWRVRRFYYNSLAQLTTAKNPESNAIGYTYDNDGNVQTKTDANGSVTTFAYVNDRITGKSYTQGGGVAATPSVSYTYDSIAGGNFGLGRRTGMTDGSGSTSWVYDAKGRVSQIGQTINTYNKTISYGYNYDDSVASITYPSGRTITYTPGAAGRPLEAKDLANSINYVTAATYAPQGALATFTNGSSISRAMTYNSRLQPLQLYFTTGTISSQTLSQLQQAPCPGTAATIMSRSYNFGQGTNDNGNVQTVTDCLNTSRTQHFEYDNLNRLLDAYTTGQTTNIAHWGEVYTIDAWGNLTNIAMKPGWQNSETLNAAAASAQNQLNG
ncbi:MAG: hypothetical protein LAO22_23620, partial [Acidobacteriia bacterium]|nr:hypothetical protein [Terriglobia bacterium]